MTNQEIFALLKTTNRLTYSTIYQDEVHSRIAGILTADDEGIYFFALRHKPYARQLLATGKVTICAYHEPPVPPHPDYQMRPGYAIRLIGDVREVTQETVTVKAERNPDFRRLLDYDYPKYQDTICFVFYRGKGEVFDYDFNLEKRDHKLLRTRFAIGGAVFNPAGFKITERCLSCGQCAEVCSYKALVPGTPYRLLGERCDECGNCYHACPVGAIDIPDIF